MSNIFPINPVDRVKELQEKSAIEKIGDEDRGMFSKHNGSEEFEEEFKEIDKKVNKIVSSEQFIKSIDLNDFENIEAKTKLLQLAEKAAATFLKKELLSVAKSILSLSNSFEDEELDDIDEGELNVSDVLARYIKKLSKTQKATTKKDSKAYAKPNPLEDRNAGFLSHFCKDILNRKIQNKNKKHDLKKLSKKDLNDLLKK